MLGNCEQCGCSGHLDDDGNNGLLPSDYDKDGNPCSYVCYHCMDAIR